MNSRPDQWVIPAVAGGLTSVAAYVAGAIAIAGLPGTSASGAEVAVYAEEHRALLLSAVFIWGLAITASAVFAVGIWGALGGPKDHAAANLIGLVAAVTLIALEFVAFAVLAALAFRPPLEAGDARLLADAFALTLSLAGLPAALWTAAAAWPALAQRQLRPWIPSLGLASSVAHVVAAGSFARSGAFAPDGAPGLVAPALIIAWTGALAVGLAARAGLPTPGGVRWLTLRRGQPDPTRAPRA
ncbi:MAG: hypothetical protein ACKVVT_09520 [Dehalococcoidia bacterium]